MGASWTTYHWVAAPNAETRRRLCTLPCGHLPAPLSPCAFLEPSLPSASLPSGWSRVQFSASPAINAQYCLILSVNLVVQDAKICMTPSNFFWSNSCFPESLTLKPGFSIGFSKAPSVPHNCLSLLEWSVLLFLHLLALRPTYLPMLPHNGPSSCQVFPPCSLRPACIYNCMDASVSIMYT